MSSTQEKLESEISKYTAGYDSGLEGEQSMLCITRHDKEQDTIVAMYRGEEADIIQALIESAKREGVEHAKSINPYPLSVFPEPDKKDWDKLNAVWKAETGNYIDSFSASLLRSGREQVIHEIEAQLKQSKESE